MPPLQLWGGLECTVNRVRDSYHCQVARNGHGQRHEDIERFASLGIRAIRYPVLWESVAPNGLRHADWRLPDERLALLREQGVQPIVGLVHHGSGPRHTSLLDAHFAPQLAAFALAVARRYPWVTHWTPVNEPLTTARFSALYGVWYPHARSDRAFLRALLNQCRAVVLCMAAVRSVNPDARLVQTDDLGESRGTPEVADIVEFYNHRRWLGWDLLCGRVDPEHPLWGYLLDNGVEAAELQWFRRHRCPPDVVGVNHYLTSDRWVDHRTALYPDDRCGEVMGRRVADVEAVRAHHEPPGGVAPLLRQAWERYGLPLAVTEAHIDAHREDQMRWLLQVWESARQLRREGVDMRAVTVWALLGSFDWNCLVTHCHGYYEPGPFDVRGPTPRPTALARLMRTLAAGREPEEPALQGPGWWQRPRELLCSEPAATQQRVVRLDDYRARRREAAARPILIAGARGRLGAAFATACAERHLACVALGRAELDLHDAAAVRRALQAHRPWAVIDASGAPADDPARGTAHAEAAGLLAEACAAEGARLLHFSGPELFDGAAAAQVLETDAPAPRTRHGQLKALAEHLVLRSHPQALAVRTATLLGGEGCPWLDPWLGALPDGNDTDAPAEAPSLPAAVTCVPALVHACLDLLIDHEQGVWHLVHPQADAREALAQVLGEAGVAVPEWVPAPASAAAEAPPQWATGRGLWLPPLRDALRHCMRQALAQRPMGEAPAQAADSA